MQAHVVSFLHSDGGNGDDGDGDTTGEGDLAGNRIATLFQFACHPTCVGPLLDQSADFIGAARGAVEVCIWVLAIVLGRRFPALRGYGCSSRGVCEDRQWICSPAGRHHRVCLNGTVG